MAGTTSTAARNQMLDSLLTGTKYVGLFTDAAGGTPSTEATGANCPGYARQAVTHAAASGGEAATNAAVLWTATGDWVPIRYLGVWDAPTGGTLLYWADCAEKDLGDTDTLEVKAGQLSTSVVDPA